MRSAFGWLRPSLGTRYSLLMYLYWPAVTVEK